MVRINTQLFIVFFLLFFCFPAQAQSQTGITSLASAINKSGRQRMLSQRILKTYSMIGIDVNSIVAREQMEGAIALFEKQKAELEAYAPTQEVKDGLKKVDRLWGPYKAAVTGKISRVKAKELLNISQELLRACHSVVLMLQDLSKTNAGYLVNISGRQRMLSQRMSMFYMYQTWEFTGAQVRSQLLQDKNEFMGALTELINAEENTAELKQELRKARSEWRLFKHGLDGVEKKPIPYIVNLAGDKLLKTMNTITGLYTELGQSSAN